MDLQQIAELILPFATGGGLVPVVNWLKGRLNLTGRMAWLLTAVIAVAVSFVVHWANGELLPGSVVWDNAGEVLIAVFGTSQAIYRALNSE